MLKLNRTTEYSLIALRHMSRKLRQEPTAVTSAREVADRYGLPFEITAKTLQRLKDTGIIQSAQGARGGYTLQRSLSEVNLAEFLRLMEGASSSMVSCCAPQGECGCEYHARCEIKGAMVDLNSRIFNFLSTIQLGEITIPES